MSETDESHTTPATNTHMMNIGNQQGEVQNADSEVQFRNDYVSTPTRQSLIRERLRPKLSFKEIETFDGTTNVSDWVWKWRHISRLNAYTEDEQLDLLPLLLKGKALTVLRSLNRTQRQSPEEILNAIIRRFEPQNLKQAKKVALFAYKMGEQEDLEDFIESLLAKARDIQLPDSDVLSIFISNVTPELRSSLMMAQPLTLAEALNVARLKAATLLNCKEEKGTTDTRIHNILEKLEAANAKQNNNEVNRIATIEEAVGRMTSLVEEGCVNKNDRAEKINAVSDTDRLTSLERSIQKLTEIITEKMDGPTQRYPRNGNQYGQQRENWQRANRHNMNTNPNRNHAPLRDMRTTDGRPICQNCKQIGHTTMSCFKPANHNRTMYATRSNGRPLNPNTQFPNRNGSQDKRQEWRGNTGAINIIRELGCDSNMNINMDILAPLKREGVKMLIDTGATISLLNSTKFESFKDHILDEEPRLKTIVSVTGSTELVEGLVNLQIQPANDPETKLSFKFHLAKLNTEEAIIGRDLLSHFESTLNLGENTMSIKTTAGNKVLAIHKDEPKMNEDVQDTQDLPDLSEYIKDEKTSLKG